MATFSSVAAFFRPLALAGAYVPIVVFIPLSLMWFGTDEAQKVGFLFIGCFVALLPLVIKDIADVPDAYLDVAVTKGASQWQLVRHVLFPVAKANIWDHLRGVYGVGWGWIIMAEVVLLPEYGLGALIGISERRSHTDAIFAVIIVIVLIAVACDQLWRIGGEVLFPFRPCEWPMAETIHPAKAAADSASAAKGSPQTEPGKTAGARPDVVVFKNVTKTFGPAHQAKVAIQDISFVVEDVPDIGELVTIV